MAKIKTPSSVRLFKTKKYISDKKSNLRYHTTKIKNCKTLKRVLKIINKTIQKFIINLKNNASNWNDRINADDFFIIDD